MKATTLIQPLALILVLPYFILDLKQRLLRLGVKFLPLGVVPRGLPLRCIQHQLLRLRLRRRGGQLLLLLLLLLLRLLEVELKRRGGWGLRLRLSRRWRLERVLQRWRRSLERVLLRWRLERVLLRRRGEGERHWRVQRGRGFLRRGRRWNTGTGRSMRRRRLG